MPNPSTNSPAVSGRPLVAVTAVLFGAVIATLNDGLPAFGLADLRGGFGLGVDQGSWLPTVFLAAQVVAAIVAPSFTIVFGARRLLTVGTVTLIMASAALPLAHEPALQLALQAVRGFTIGMYIPSAIPFIMRNLPKQWWIWGIAAYAFRFIFSQNVAAATEAFLIDHGGWQWLIWKDLPLAAVLVPLIWIGMPRVPVSRARLLGLDWIGIAMAGAGASLLYIGLDQGERLDWFHSGLVCGLFAASALLIAGFLVHERTTPAPLIDLTLFRNVNLAIPHLLIVIFIFGAAGTAFLVPNYLATIQGLRSLDIGNALIWVALPQVVAIPAAVMLVRWFDVRLVLAFGLALIAGGAWLNTFLTHDWIGATFTSSLLIEAVGLAIALIALIVFTFSHAVPAQVPTLSTTIQTARLLGAEFALAAMRRIVDLREQLYSNLIGLHVTPAATAASPATAIVRGHLASREADPVRAAGQLIAQVARTVAREAHVLAYIDAFWIVAWTVTAALAVVALVLRHPPGPTVARIGSES